MSFIDALKHRLYVIRRGERYAAEQERELHAQLQLGALSRRAPNSGVSARRAFGNVPALRGARVDPVVTLRSE